jgi:hypothetical protein
MYVNAAFLCRWNTDDAAYQARICTDFNIISIQRLALALM